MKTFIVGNQIFSALFQIFGIIIFLLCSYWFVEGVLNLIKHGWSKKIGGDIFGGLLGSLLFGLGVVNYFFSFSRIDVTPSNSWILKNDFNITIGTIINPSIEKPELSISRGSKGGFYLIIKIATKNFETSSAKKEELEYIKQNLTF